MALFHIIIDGYNFLHASAGTDHDWTYLSLEEGRGAIIDFLATRRRARREKITVVFDGSAAAEYEPRQENVHGIEVLFSEPGATADELIRQTVTSAPDRRSILVVTADREIRDAVVKAGAKILAPLTFLVSSDKHHQKQEKMPPKEPPEKFKGVGPGEVDYWRKVMGFSEEEHE